jgi:hypothetical protein
MRSPASIDARRRSSVKRIFDKIRKFSRIL